MAAENIKNKLRSMFRKATAEAALAQEKERRKGPPLMVIGSDDKPYSEARRAFQLMIGKSVCNGTCLKCQKKYPASWPLLGEDRTIPGWYKFKSTMSRFGSEALACKDCVPNEHDFWVDLRGFDDEKRDGYTLYASLAGAHMDDLSMQEREELLEKIKETQGADRVVLSFAADKTENDPEYWLGKYVELVTEKAIQDKRCTYCGEHCPVDELPTEKGIFCDNDWGLVKAQGCDKLVLFCRECAMNGAVNGFTDIRGDGVGFGLVPNEFNEDDD